MWGVLPHSAKASPLTFTSSPRDQGFSALGHLWLPRLTTPSAADHISSETHRVVKGG